MFSTFLAAVLAVPSPATIAPRPVRATAQATATIRILSSASIRWQQRSPDLPKLRSTQMRGATGELQPIKLIEFE